MIITLAFKVYEEIKEYSIYTKLKLSKIQTTGPQYPVLCLSKKCTFSKSALHNISPQRSKPSGKL